MEFEKLLTEYNDKAYKARTGYKMPMYAYYMTKIFAILDIVGRTKEVKQKVPELANWYRFCKEK